MLYMLSQKPQVLKKLRQEILDHIGPSVRPTHEDLRDLKYLRATINGTPSQGMHNRVLSVDRVFHQKRLDCSLQCNNFRTLSAGPRVYVRVYRPSNLRYATQDAIWPAIRGGQPFFIPAGTRCVYSVFAMHRRTDLWGPDGKYYNFCRERAEGANETFRTE